jgi:RNA polymerase sigma factor (sigma-70 family)
MPLKSYRSSLSVNESPPRNGKSGLTQEALNTLLFHLDSDRELAGEKYRIIQRKLVRFFEYHNCTCPEDHADEVLDRVAGKLSKGTTIEDIPSYCLGVARKLFKEILREREKIRASLAQLASFHAESEGENSPDARLDCFDQCLEKLDDEERDIIMKYYKGEKKAKIESRKQLAEELGIPLNALRIRTHRIREKLEKCINDCLAGKQ